MRGYVELFSAALTPVIAIIATYIAYRQHRNDTLKLKHDLYEKRYETFTALMEFIVGIMRSTKVELGDLAQFNSAKNKGYFLVGEDLSEYLEQVYKKGVDLYALNTKLSEGNLPVGPERARVANEKGDLVIWFAEQVNVARAKFEKYLSLQ